MFSRCVILTGGVLSALAIVVGWWAWHRSAPPVRELPRSALELRDGMLYPRGESDPFTGLLFEDHDSTVRKLEIAIRGGRAHGLSRGWHRSGQIEVEEHFVNGVSQGVRTRWHANGRKRSEARIADGQLDGSYTEWHDNGQKAVEMTLRRGKADGLSTSWHPNGALKAKVRHRDGVIVERELFPDAAANGSTRVTATR